VFFGFAHAYVATEIQKFLDKNTDKNGENTAKNGENDQKSGQNGQKTALWVCPTHYCTMMCENIVQLAINDDFSPETSDKTAISGEKTAKNGENGSEMAKITENGSEMTENGSEMTENGSKTAENSSKTAENRSKTTENAPKTAQNAPKTVLKPDSGYIPALISGIPGEISIFWTGPTIISAEISAKHLQNVSKICGNRKIILWDNLFCDCFFVV
jgi:hypothetical protein